MAIPVIMPRQGQSVESCIITTWLKKKGERVSEGELLLSYETDKASFDLESPAEGILLDQFFHEGDEVPVLINIGVIGSEGDDIESFRPAPAGKKEAAADHYTGTHIETTQKASPGLLISDEITGRVKISPRAKKIAAAKGISISTLKGSGPAGRILAADVEKGSSGSSFSDKPLSNVRKLISKAMHSSLQNSAQLTHHMSADARKILDARKKTKELISSGKEKQDITLNDMICWCVIRALKKFPEMNSHFLDTFKRNFNTVNLGIAIDTERGLMVPALQGSDNLDIKSLSKAIADLAETCRKGNVDPELLKSTSGSFTVSNLGAYGVEMFTPVLNLPQTGILGVCTITHRPSDMGNGVIGFLPFLGLSLTYDHRSVDGAPATLFLAEVKKEIENFTLN